MGNLFQLEKQKSQRSEQMMKYLKKYNLESLNDCFEIINEDYENQQSINFEDFNNIFGSVLDNYIELFFVLIQNQKDIEGMVDIYECVSTLVISSGTDFQDKLDFIFHLFDFNKNGVIEMDELNHTLTCAIRGICKIAEVKIPTKEEIETYSISIFDYIDEDCDKNISIEEFQQWIDVQFELQDFLIKFIQVPTFNCIYSRYLILKKFFLDIFEQVTFKKDSICCNRELLFQKLEQSMLQKQYNQSMVDVLISAINQSRKFYGVQFDDSQVSRNVYENSVKAFASFKAADYNNDYKICKNEMCYIFYCYEDGHKVSQKRIEYEFQTIDKENTGYIQFIDWLKYVTLSGVYNFKCNLKLNFHKYDKNENGYVEIQEFREIIEEKFVEFCRQTHKINNEEKAYMVSSLVNTVYNKLKQINNIQEDIQFMKINWITFKDAFDIALVELQKLNQFLIFKY